MHAESLKENEIYNFLSFLCASHYYDQSPSVLTSADQQGNFGPAAHIISCERYLKILRSLSHRTEDNWIQLFPFFCMLIFPGNRCIPIYQTSHCCFLHRIQCARSTFHKITHVWERRFHIFVKFWEMTHGVDVLTRLLATLHGSTSKHQDIEAVLWDFIIRLNLAQAFHTERWSAAGIAAIEAAQSFAQLTRLDARDQRTFMGFLSYAMAFFCKKARREVIPAAALVVANTNERIASLTSIANFLAYWNGPDGKRIRGVNTVHYVIKKEAKRICRVCHGVVAGCKRTMYFCATCIPSVEGQDNGIPLCGTARVHELDGNNMTSCWDLWHSSGFTIQNSVDVAAINNAAAAAGVEEA